MKISPAFFFFCLLKVLLSPHVAEARFAVYVAVDVQLVAKTRWTTVEYASFCRSVDLANRLEDGIPWWSAKGDGRAQTGDGVDIGIGIVD